MFVDKEGRQVVTLEVTIERDFSALSEFIGRVIPGANVKVNSLNGSIVLTGTVQNPIDATRAGEIAKAFVAKGERQELRRLDDTDLQKTRVTAAEPLPAAVPRRRQRP